jgi:hypothetical protein
MTPSGGASPPEVPAAEQLGAPEGPAASALAVLLGSGRAAFADSMAPSDVAVQFARCPLLGHAILLSPAAAERLEAATGSVAS